MNEAGLSHTRWDCTYHIVWMPKYRRKVPCQQSRPEVGALVRGLFERKGCEVAGGSVRGDHVHACVRIPPKLAVTHFSLWWHHMQDTAFASCLVNNLKCIVIRLRKPQVPPVVQTVVPPLWSL